MKISPLLLALFLIPVFAKCQPVPLEGTVMDPRGHPLANVTVMLIRTGEEVVAGQNGGFRFANAFSTDSIRATLVGYLPRTVVNNDRGRLIIILDPDPRTLSEVIVSSGYQELPKERATGSFNQLDHKLLNEQISTTLLDRLPAIANSVTLDRRSIGGGLMIRGLSTINGVRDPLIILNNFPYEGDLANINPNDIESITILKDAAAASIWGARAGNGVIVITTRRAGFNQPVRVEWNAAVGITHKPDLYAPKVLNSDEYIDIERFLFSKEYRFSDTSDINRPVISPVYEILFRQQRGEISSAETERLLAELGKIDLRDQYLRYMFRTGINRQHALQVSGGSLQNAWRFMAGFDNNTSSLSDNYKRVTLRAANNFRVTERLLIRTDITYTHGTELKGHVGTGTGSADPFPNYTALVNPDGSAASVPYMYRQSYLDTVGQGKLLDWNYYPLLEKEAVKNKTALSHLLGNLAVEYRIGGLRLSGQYQYERQNLGSFLHQTMASYETRHLINYFTEIDPASGEPTYHFPMGDMLTRGQRNLLAQNIRGQVDYNGKWNRHAINVLAGAEQRTRREESTSQQYYGYDPDTWQFVDIDPVGYYPTFFTGFPSQIYRQSTLDRRRDNFISYFANGAYTYDERYTISLSGRRDASNLFGLKTNDKWTPLWSGGVSWNVSNEKFFNVAWLPYLRLRATLGYSGNTDPTRVASTTFSYLSSTTLPVQYAVLATPSNPGLRWERVRMFNVGIDFANSDKRITGSLEYYTKRAIDLFGPAQLDYTGGVGGTITKNVAAMRAYGVDLLIHSSNLTGELGWTTDLNLSLNRDKITSYYLPPSSRSGISTIPAPSKMEGKPVYSVYSYAFAGLDPLTGNPRGYLNGVISENYSNISLAPQESLQYHGPAFPTVFGSMGNTFTYKRFALAIRLIGKFGYYFFRTTVNYTDMYGRGITHTDYRLRWQKPGDEQSTTVPSAIYPANPERDGFYKSSAAMVEKGDHLRLQYINLSYSWQPQGRLGKALRSMQLTANASELGLLWTATKSGLDPDYVDGAIPRPRSFALRLTAIF